MNVIGICDGPDAGAAYVKDGRIIAAINEERLSRIKLHTGYFNGFPFRSIKFVLNYINPDDIDVIAIPGLIDPILPFRILGLYWKLRDFSPTTGIDVNKKRIQLYLKAYFYDYFCKRKAKSLTGRFSKTTFEYFLRKALKKFNLEKKEIVFVDHHMAHVAAAHYTSGLEETTTITMDGHGDGLSASVNICSNNNIKRIKEVKSSNSLGWFYGAITNLAGFKQHRHEGKITGLAAYGDPHKLYKGSTECISYDKKTKQPLNKLGPKFIGMAKVAKHMDITIGKEHVAAAAQKRLEDVTLPFIKDAIKKTKNGHLALAGGIFANVKLNMEIHNLKEVRSIFIFPHIGDGGLAAGAALYVHGEETKKQGITQKPAKLKDVYFGPSYTKEEIENELKKSKLDYSYHNNVEKKVADLLAKGKVVARFDGRMEFGPRALGNRSILYQPTDKTVNDWLNERLKRTEFMPFAPVTLAEYEDKSYIGMEGGRYAARFMTIDFKCERWMKRKCAAVVHLDNTARPQIIDKETNPDYYKIVNEYRKITGLPTIINTSFNMHEEPIVCTPYDAIRAFKLGHLDVLSMDKFIVTNS